MEIFNPGKLPPTLFLATEDAAARGLRLSDSQNPDKLRPVTYNDAGVIPEGNQHFLYYT